MAITIDGTALSAAGWHLSRSTGLDDLPALSLSTVSLPLREDAVVSSDFRTPAPRDGVLTVWTKADTVGELATATNALNATLGSPLVLGHVRRPNQRLTVYVMGAPASYGIGPEAVAPFYLEYGLRVQAPSPWWEDATEQSVNFTTQTAIPQGTVSVRGVITITASGGSVVNPTVTMKDSSDVTVWSVSPTVTILDGDAWRIDGVLGQVRKRVSGVWSNAVTTLPDSFTLPVYRREYSDFAGSDWVSLTLTGTNGLGNTTYRRRYA